MRRIAYILFTMLLSLQALAADSHGQLWNKANDCYSRKAYDSAAMYYEQLATLSPGSAVVYYNLGNAYYRLNNVGRSVLNYERAIRLDPGYQQAKDNLSLAQARISNHIIYNGDIFFIKWWKSLTRPDKASGWAVGALVSFALVFILLMVRKFGKGAMARIPVQVPGVLGFVCLCLLIVAFASSRNVVAHNSAVVMQDDAPLMNMGQKGKPLALIPEGTTVKIQSDDGVWLEVRLPDGRTGWLQHSAVTRI